MAYEGTKAPDPHYVVTVTIKEVTPAHKIGSGSSAFSRERVVEDMLTFSVREDEYGHALDAAMMHLKTAGAGK